MINTIKTTFTDRAFLKTALALIFPIALQNLLMSGVNFLDNIMIGRLGETSIAAVSLANQYYFVVTLICFGICSGSGVFMSQFRGKGDFESIRMVMLLNIIGVCTVSAVSVIGGIFFPESIMRIFTKDTEVINLGIKYFSLIVIGYIPTGISMSFQIGLKSIGRTRIPLLMSFLTLCMNGLFNYMFIFGNFGAPALGVTGAAIATTLSRIIEMILTTGLVKMYSPDLMIKFSDIKRVTKDFMNRFLQTVMPVKGNETIWGLGTCLYSFVYGRMGTDTVAAVSIATTVEKLLNVIMMGVGNAAVVMIGTKIGEGNIKAGKDYASRFTVISWLFGGVIALIIIMATPYALMMFKVEASVNRAASGVLMDIALISLIQFYGFTHIVGTMRSGGDTRFCMYMDIIGVWGISLPLLAFMGLILKLPIQYTYLALVTEHLVKTIVISYRLKSGKWIRNLVKDI